MNKSIHITNQKGFMNLIHAFNCKDNELVFLDSTDFEIRYSEIKPPADDYQPQENFPDCCNFHKNIKQNVQIRIDKFPSCCDLHARLVNEKWFDKRNYHGLPTHTVNAVHYTEFHLANKINEEDWYEEITEYIEYCVYSFGQFPSGYGPPLALEDYLVNTKYILEYRKKEDDYPNEKIDKIISFIDNISKPIDTANQSDINILIGHYQKWLKEFPFELSYFSHLKADFFGSIPILSGEKTNNRYLGTVKAKVVTYKELLNVLVETTKKILLTFNSFQLYQDGKLSDIDQKMLDLINSKRRLELNKMSETAVKERKRYIKIIKVWIKDEKAYLKEISSMFDKSINHNIFIKD